MKTIKVLLTAALMLCAAGAWAQAAAPAEELITMYVGQVRTLPLARVSRVAVGNGKVLSTTVLDNEMLLLAETPGDTGMHIWLKDGTQRRYNVRIAPSDVSEAMAQLSRIIAGVPGVRVERVGDFVVLTGATTKANMTRIASAVQGGFKQVVNMLREEEVTMRKMVYLKVQLIEFKRSALENLGVRWATEISGPAAGLAFDAITSGGFTARQTDGGIASAAPSTAAPGSSILAAPVLQGLPLRVSPPRAYLGILTSITSRINLAVNNGDAYVLATPELSTRSGGEAKFLAGGQIPIVVPASGFSPPSVTYKDYGIKLNIAPTADEQNNIVATIKTEVSSLDPSTSVQGNPGFLMRQTDSEINVRDGQTIVMSGLVNADLSNQIDKLPWLGDIPILGVLFKSTAFRNNRTDLVVFVTPQVVDPSSTLTRERINKGRDINEKYEGFLQKKGIVD
jgi:pilus assembly protein CpaC